MREIFEEIKRDMDDFFTEIDKAIGRTPEPIKLVGKSGMGTISHLGMEDDDELPTSDCCGAMVYEDYGICSDCKEHV